MTQDVDLWFEPLDDPKLATALREVGGAYVPPLTPPMFAGEGLELFDIVLRMDGLACFAAEWANAMEMVLGDVTAKVLPLSRVLVSKRADSPPKDRLVIPVLEDVLALRAAQQDSDPTNSGVARPGVPASYTFDANGNLR